MRDAIDHQNSIPVTFMCFVAFLLHLRYHNVYWSHIYNGWCALFEISLPSHTQVCQQANLKEQLPEELQHRGSTSTSAASANTAVSEVTSNMRSEKILFESLLIPNPYNMVARAGRLSVEFSISFTQYTLSSMTILIVYLFGMEVEPLIGSKLLLTELSNLTHWETYTSFNSISLSQDFSHSTQHQQNNRDSGEDITMLVRLLALCIALCTGQSDHMTIWNNQMHAVISTCHLNSDWSIHSNKTFGTSRFVLSVT